MPAALATWLLTLGGWLAVTGVVLVVVFWFYGDLYKHPRSARPVIEGLRLDRGVRRYHEFLALRLDAVDRAVGRWEVAVRGIVEQDAQERAMERNRAPWSYGLLDLTLLLALAYPIILVIGQWVLLGSQQDARLGALTLLPAQSDWWWRYGTVPLLVGSVSFGVLARRALVRAQLPLLAFALQVSFALGLIGVFIGAGANAGAIAAPLAIALAVTLIVIFSAGVAVAIRYVRAGTLATAFAVSGRAVLGGAFAGAYALAFALAGVVAMNGAGGLTVGFMMRFSFAFLVAMTILTAIDILRFFAEGWARDPMPVLLAWALTLTVVLVAAPSQLDLKLDDLGTATSLLLFLGFLPLINALADFGSTGLTRLLLRQGAGESADQGKGGRLWLWGPLDLLAGAGIFFLLGFALIATVRLVTWLGGPPLLDLPMILGSSTVEGSILNAPGDYWWLYVTFLSTLLPTALHAMVALFSVFLLWPKRWRRYMANGLTRGIGGDVVAGRWATGLFCLLVTGGIVGALALIWFGARGLHAAHPQIGVEILAVFRWFAGIVGAV